MTCDIPPQKNTLSPESASNIQRVYKVVFVGDSGVGKSSFIHRYCFELWKPSYTATIGNSCFETFRSEGYVEFSYYWGYGDYLKKKFRATCETVIWEKVVRV